MRRWMTILATTSCWTWLQNFSFEILNRWRLETKTTINQNSNNRIEMLIWLMPQANDVVASTQTMPVIQWLLPVIIHTLCAQKHWTAKMTEYDKNTPSFVISDHYTLYSTLQEHGCTCQHLPGKFHCALEGRATSAQNNKDRPVYPHHCKLVNCFEKKDCHYE